MPTELLFKSITEVSTLIKGHHLSPSELNEECLAHIEKTDPLINSFTTVAFDYSRKRAKAATDEIMRGEYKGPLHGIPYTLKDVIATKDVRTTFGNPNGTNYSPKNDATVHTLLEQAGGILIGKVYSQIGRGSLPVECYNPWDLRFSPGTSSSGSGASVASGMGFVSLGTDTGGSVRHPAANCNLVGFRLSTGMISRFGVIHPSWMSDQAGPLCRTVEDCSTVSTILAGYDPNDPISLPYPVPDYNSYLSGTLTQLKVGIPVDRWLWNWESEEVENIVRTAISCLSKLGAELIPINLPRNEEGWDAHFKITLPELACYYQDNFSASELEQWPEISGRIAAGKNQTFSDYYHAQQVADGIRQEVELAFQDVDLIVMPTGANIGVRGDAETIIIRGQEVSTKSKAVHINNIAAMTGCPAISVPCGFTSENKLPVGLQIIGRRFAEPTVLQAAFAYEQANQWYKEHPKLR